MPGVMDSQKGRYRTHSPCPPYNGVPFSRLIKTGLQAHSTFQSRALQKLNIFGKLVNKHKFLRNSWKNKSVFLECKNENMPFRTQTLSKNTTFWHLIKNRIISDFQRERIIWTDEEEKLKMHIRIIKMLLNNCLRSPWVSRNEHLGSAEHSMFARSSSPSIDLTYQTNMLFPRK